ncbi:MAG: polysaccharide deacetylase family protein [Promethearchaeota archaeon]
MIILLFHGVTKKSVTPSFRTFIPKSNFILILKYLKKKKYRFITLTEWVKIIKKKKKINGKYIILTFDDGYRNVIDVAYPIMQKYGAKGCIYIISKLIESEQLLWTDYIKFLLKQWKNENFILKINNQEFKYSLRTKKEREYAIGDIKNRIRKLTNQERLSILKDFPINNSLKNFKNISEDYKLLNYDDLDKIDKNILEVGSHTRTHPNLNSITEEELYEELFISKCELEKKINRPIVHLCYPAGKYNSKIIQFAKKYNYLTGTTTEYGFNSIKTNLFKLKRIDAKGNFIIFKYKLSGAYLFYQKLLKIFFNIKIH